ncbi:hypothetical protein AVEN_230162-1 [Araneus ventricosus]|uniref:Uncharacterized protein n=1 Tax=Araneus ventricosus TaxID=182803 RepID=A0A4Y2R8F1_ARAVE|nr:hypothetical protein AVEN_230162-1 [Araneus ventricosus]
MCQDRLFAFAVLKIENTIDIDITEERVPKRVFPSPRKKDSVLYSSASKQIISVGFICSRNCIRCSFRRKIFLTIDSGHSSSRLRLSFEVTHRHPIVKTIHLGWSVRNSPHRTNASSALHSDPPQPSLVKYTPLLSCTYSLLISKLREKLQMGIETVCVSDLPDFKLISGLGMERSNLLGVE